MATNYLIGNKEISKTTAEDKYRYFSLFLLHNKMYEKIFAILSKHQTRVSLLLELVSDAISLGNLTRAKLESGASHLQGACFKLILNSRYSSNNNSVLITFISL